MWRRRRQMLSRDGCCDETSAFEPAMSLVVVAAAVAVVAVVVGVLVADLGSLLGRLAALWLRM